MLARRCMRAGSDGEEGLAEIWVTVQAEFALELEPHFAVEERLLLPPLALAGQTALVERTNRDHTRLRALIARDAVVLQEFGTLLHAHVRFEEQELFPCAEQVLSADHLEAVATASAALETAQRRVRTKGPFTVHGESYE